MRFINRQIFSLSAINLLELFFRPFLAALSLYTDFLDFFNAIVGVD